MFYYINTSYKAEFSVKYRSKILKREKIAEFNLNINSNSISKELWNEFKGIKNGVNYNIGFTAPISGMVNCTNSILQSSSIRDYRARADNLKDKGDGSNFMSGAAISILTPEENPEISCMEFYADFFEFMDQNAHAFDAAFSLSDNYQLDWHKYLELEREFMSETNCPVVPRR